MRWSRSNKLMGVIEDVLALIADRGGRGAVVPVSRFADLRRDLDNLRHGDFHTRWLDKRAAIADQFVPDTLGFQPRSVIVVVLPSVKVSIRFDDAGTPVECLVPPTYTDLDAPEAELLSDLNASLCLHGYSAAVVGNRLPAKLLAVHCGLALYGRNNIAFSEEFGSYMGVLMFYTDMPCGDTPWHPVGRLPICEKCYACIVACPTGAIDKNREIVDADRCLTALNEPPGVFPDWVTPDMHNCLVGCMKCQDCCPVNAPFRKLVTQGASFNGDATAELLGHRDGDTYSASLAAQIGDAGLGDYAEVLPRNLKVLIGR